MSEPDGDPPARRVVHVCYCCDDADAVTDFFVGGLKMKNTMRTPDEYSAGSVLGLSGRIRSLASFVYDHRGPRVSPAIEIQAWFEPATVGLPSTDPFEAGIKALGFAVPSVDDAVAELVDLGCTVVADAPTPFAERQVALLDPLGVMLELVEAAELGPGTTRLQHLRATVTDLALSLPFYDALGFTEVDRAVITDAVHLGVDVPVEGECVRLRLPDEPFELRLHEWTAPAGHGRHYTEPNHRGIFRVAMAVDDARVSYDRLVADGVAFDRAPIEIELNGTPVPDMWITFLSDPDGIPFEFVQRPRSAFRH